MPNSQDDSPNSVKANHPTHDPLTFADLREELSNLHQVIQQNLLVQQGNLSRHIDRRIQDTIDRLTVKLTTQLEDHTNAIQSMITENTSLLAHAIEAGQESEPAPSSIAAPNEPEWREVRNSGPKQPAQLSRKVHGEPQNKLHLSGFFTHLATKRRY